jgi:catechol 2,3-dioxygenase-like lactoylglutathione lyase family enzyme
LAERVRPRGVVDLASVRHAFLDRKSEAVAAMSTSDGDGTEAVTWAVTGIGEIAINTSDLNRFRTFYEGLLGLPHVISLKMAQAPHLRYGVFAVGLDTALLAFEVPGYDPAADGLGVEVGRRGRIDHFSLRVDEAALFEVRDRLVAAGASEGAVTNRGPYRSLTFRDPDGLEGTITCPNPAFDPSQVDDELIECSNPQWTANLLQQ